MSLGPSKNNRDEYGAIPKLKQYKSDAMFEHHVRNYKKKELQIDQTMNNIMRQPLNELERNRISNAHNGNSTIYYPQLIQDQLQKKRDGRKINTYNNMLPCQMTNHGIKGAMCRLNPTLNVHRGLVRNSYQWPRDYHFVTGYHA